jgi:hypothetical protein
LLRSARLFIAVALLSTALPQARALATGGPNIGAAPAVVYGKQLFGNTAADGQGKTPTGCINGVSWWLLPTLAGDKVTIDFEGGVDFLDVWPVGTTDFNLNTANPFKEFPIGDNGKQEGVFTTPVSGAMPLEFFTGVCFIDGNGQPGPYDFTTTDQHAIVVALKRYLHIKTTTTLTGTASLADGAPAPDGLTFKLTVSWPGQKAKYTATSTGGTLTFPLTLPSSAKGKMATFVVTRPADAQYQAAKSATSLAQVARVKRHRHRHHHN